MDPIVAKTFINIINDAFDNRIPNTIGVLESAIDLGYDCGKSGLDPQIWCFIGEYAQAAYDHLTADLYYSDDWDDLEWPENMHDFLGDI